ncbi:MAG: hypothetical protein KGI67_06150 [Pseudomonadota bacterium]|nr:hypothetical protein [Pseudomonadota bacterium]
MNGSGGRWKPASLLGALGLGAHEPEPAPTDDIAKAVDDVARLLLAFNQSPEDPTSARLEALMSADGGCQGLLREFRLQCLQRPAGSQDSETGWNALDAVHRQFARCYEKFLLSHRDGASGSPAEGHLGTIAARLLFHIAMLRRLAIFRTQPLDARLWRLAHQVYGYAEKAGVHTRPIAMYSSPERIETTCQCVYARLLMLDTLGNGGFTARQVDMVDGWLGEWITADLMFREYCEGRFRYQVDLESDIGATRLMGAPYPDSARFIDTEVVCVQIERLRRSLRSGEVTGLLTLGSGFKGVEFVELLDRLERVWSLAWMGQDQRVHRREKVEDGWLEVVRGLPELCSVARRETEGGSDARSGKPLTAAEEMDIKIYGFVTERTRARLAEQPGAEGGLEKWKLFDRSSNGFGSLLPVGSEHGLRAGLLIGVRVAGSRRWGVGTVARRVGLRDSGEVFVGVEILSATPVIVSIEPTGRELAVASPLNIPAGRENQWALFLPGAAAQGRPDSLVIDTSMYSTARQFQLTARNVSYAIRMNRILGKGEGWQRVGFEVLAKRS